MRHYRKGVLLGMSLAEVFILLLFLFSFVVLSDRVPAPVISSATMASGRVGTPFSYQITASNSPTSYGATGLPSGLSINTATGAIIGTPTTEGVFPVTISATNAGGTGQATLTLTIEAAGEPEVPTPNESDGVFPPADSTQTSADPSMSEGLVADSPQEDEFPAESASSKWPPIINLYEAGGYSFPKGQASLSAEFVEDLNGPIVSRLLGYIEEYRRKDIMVDVVEVVGHTDEQPVRGYSNLDEQLVDVMRGSGVPDRLSAADNVGLGMARAAAVAQVLRPAMESQGVKVIAYSAGQTIEQGDKISEGQDVGDSARRRRIEIRMRPSMAADE